MYEKIVAITVLGESRERKSGNAHIRQKCQTLIRFCPLLCELLHVPSSDCYDRRTCAWSRTQNNLFFVDGVEWASKEETAGGLVGEPLTIDCAATATPEPTITITDGAGEPLDGQFREIGCGRKFESI